MSEPQTAKQPISATPAGEPQTSEWGTPARAASATWSSATFPAVPPNAKFRADLQRALEQTHRQQTAQRKIGAQPAAGRRQLQQPRFLLALLILAIMSVAGLWWLFKPKPVPGATRP